MYSIEISDDQAVVWSSGSRIFGISSTKVCDFVE